MIKLYNTLIFPNMVHLVFYLIIFRTKFTKYTMYIYKIYFKYLSIFCTFSVKWLKGARQKYVNTLKTWTFFTILSGNIEI